MVEQFEVYQEFAHKGVRRAIYVIELEDVVCHGEEGAIVHLAILRGQLGDLRRIRL